jgi:hypothetical protein
MVKSLYKAVAHVLLAVFRLFFQVGKNCFNLNAQCLFVAA